MFTLNVFMVLPLLLLLLLIFVRSHLLVLFKDTRLPVLLPLMMFAS